MEELNSEDNVKSIIEDIEYHSDHEQIPVIKKKRAPKKKQIVEIPKTLEEIELEQCKDFNSALEMGLLHALKYFVKERPSYMTYANCKLLRDACRLGHVHIVEWALAHLTDSDIRKSNNDALGQACLAGNLEIVKMLMNRLKVEDIRDLNRRAFKNAMQSKNINLINYLISFGLVEYDGKFKVGHEESAEDLAKKIENFNLIYKR
jgi:hypothetical protein